MSKRCVDWKESLSKDLIKSKEYRRDFFLALLKEGFTWREALEFIVKAIGVKEYAELSDFKAPNLVTQLKLDKDIRVSTLEKMVKPIGINIFGL